MNDLIFIAILLIGTAAGGALGAYFARASVAVGASTTAVATVVQFLVGEAADIQQTIIQSLVYLATVGLIAGRWGFGLTGRQMVQVVVGSFLVPLIVGVIALYAAPDYFVNV